MEDQKKVSVQETTDQNENRVFDDVFRTMLERIPEVMIPLINKVFGTKYAEDETITQLRNEHYTKGGAVVTDCLLNICGKQYHLECQSNPDNTIALRMIEYDMAIALQEVKQINLTSGTEHDYELTFPNSCVLYLRHNSQTKDNAGVRIRFQDGTSHIYKIPIVKVQEYAKEEIFEKKLLAFLPYYLMRYENRVHEICKDKVQSERLQREYLDIRERLEASMGKEKGMLYVELISHMKRVADYVLKHEPEMRERMEEIAMVGQVYETLTDQLLAQGRETGLYIAVGRLVDSEQYTERKACELLGAEYEEYLKYKEKMYQEQMVNEQPKDVAVEKERELKTACRRPGLRR